MTPLESILIRWTVLSKNLPATPRFSLQLVIPNHREPTNQNSVGFFSY